MPRVHRYSCSRGFTPNFHTTLKPSQNHQKRSEHDHNTYVWSCDASQHVPASFGCTSITRQVAIFFSMSAAERANRPIVATRALHWTAVHHNRCIDPCSLRVVRNDCATKHAHHLREAYPLREAHKPPSQSWPPSTPMPPPRGRSGESPLRCPRPAQSEIRRR